MTPESTPRQARSAAGIVIYRPDFPALLRLVAAIAPDNATIGIVANSSISFAEEAALARAAVPAELLVIRPGLNRGLGAAYNMLLDMARDREVEHLLLLDQDSIATPGMTARLAATHEALEVQGARAVAVGPQPHDEGGNPMRLPAAGAPCEEAAGRPSPVSFLISSGTLLRVDRATAVGPFRADFFIDAIDIEWCMRALAQGLSLWAARDVPMPHRLGRGVIRLPLGLLLTDQPPRRLYTYLRNQLAMLRLGHVPVAHKLKFLVTLPVRCAVYLWINRFSAETLAALANGLRDGIANRLGPPDRAFRGNARGGRSGSAPEPLAVTAPRLR